MTAAIPRPNPLEGVPSDAWLRVCWVPRKGDALCGGPVSWLRVAGNWFSFCSKCEARGVAAVGERVALDAMHPDVGGGA